MNVFRDIMRLPEGASTFAYEVDLLHLVVISVTMLGALGVALTSLVFVARYSGRPPGLTRRHPTPVWFEGGAVTFLLALFLGWWVLGFLTYVRIQTPPATAGVERVYVVAKQWMWKFVYPSGRTSANLLVVPRDRPVRLIMMSRDVIHSFFVPAFRLKQDVLPGRYTTAWFQATKAGRYRVMCAEFCGNRHAEMWAEVEVLEPEAYARWLAEADLQAGDPRHPSVDLAEQGRRVAQEKACLGCHATSPIEPAQAYVGPSWVGLYGKHVRLEDGSSVVADEAYLTRSMMRPGREIVAGYDDIMPTYQGQLTATETAALVELIRSLDDPPPTLRDTATPDHQEGAE